VVTIDANVLVAASISTESHHPDSVALLTRLRQRGVEVICPSLVIAETVAAIARPTGDVALALQSIRLISRFPNITLLNLTQRRSRAAARLAANLKLRGADSVYVGAAVESAATLITWETQILQRAPVAVSTMTPTDWLAANP
jgi:predicted nucleic acid-binding protein